MPNTFQFLADRRYTNSSVQGIEVRRTRTQYCSNHQFIVFEHQDGDSTSAKLIERRDVEQIEWNQNIVLDPSDSIRFDVTNYCPGVQDLATCIFNQEHHTDLQKPDLCYCFQWV